MSWDVSIVTQGPLEVYERGVTWNNYDIFLKSLGCPFRDLNGQRASSILDKLSYAIQDILQHRIEYEALEPPNGWGGIEDVLRVLRGMRDACEEYPEGVVSIT